VVYENALTKQPDNEETGKELVTCYCRTRHFNKAQVQAQHRGQGTGEGGTNQRLMVLYIDSLYRMVANGGLYVYVCVIGVGDAPVQAPPPTTQLRTMVGHTHGLSLNTHCLWLG
jgi:hypothetical protein